MLEGCMRTYALQWVVRQHCSKKIQSERIQCGTKLTQLLAAPLWERVLEIRAVLAPQATVLRWESQET